MRGGTWGFGFVVLGLGCFFLFWFGLGFFLLVCVSLFVGFGVFL